MPESRRTPQRRSPFDKLAPRDFVEDGAWPDGRPRVPDELEDGDFTDEQKQAALVAVRELRSLAQDYIAHVGRKETTRKTFARKVGISENTLAALASGSRFPQWHTYAILAAVLPTARQRRTGVREGEASSRRRSPE